VSVLAVLLTLGFGAITGASAQQGGNPPCDPNKPGNGPPCDPGPPCTPPGQGKNEPYSSSTTEPPCGRRKAKIKLSVSSGSVGDRVEVHASGLDAGDRVDVTFGGQPVGSGTARPDQGQQALGRVFAAIAPVRMLTSSRSVHVAQAAGAGNSSVDLVFSVPDVDAGTYDVCASSPNVDTACAPFDVVEVLGARFSRGEGGNGVRVLGRTFARTGIDVAILAILGVSLIVAGRSLRAGSKRRRRVRA
jgi:hypothetical protein